MRKIERIKEFRSLTSGDVDDQRQCKIILTSRSRDLLLCNDMKSQKNSSIDALSKKEALQLFENIVGDSTKILLDR